MVFKKQCIKSSRQKTKQNKELLQNAQKHNMHSFHFELFLDKTAFSAKKNFCKL